MKKTVLVLYATYGNGHRMVANYIKEYFNKLDDINVEIVDLLDYASPFAKKATLKLFEKTMFVKLPIIWEILYKFYDNKYRSIGIRKVCYKLFDKDRLRKKINSLNPDVIISTHYFGSIMAAKYKKEGLIDSKLYTIITDYEIHEFWIKSYKYEETIVVSTKEMRKDLISRNIPKEKIKVFGIPISDNFDLDLDKADLKRKYKVDNDKITILFFGGGNNSTSCLPFFKKLVMNSKNFNIIFIAGNNHDIKQKAMRVAKDYRTSNIKILGYVNNVYEYMMASDLIISKPGGLTVSECLFLQKPMLIINRNAGQEKGNYKYLVKNGYAIKASTPKKFLKYINILDNNHKFIEKMTKNLIKRNKKSSIDELYKLICK